VWSVPTAFLVFKFGASHLTLRSAFEGCASEPETRGNSTCPVSDTLLEHNEIKAQAWLLSLLENWVDNYCQRTVMQNILNHVVQWFADRWLYVIAIVLMALFLFAKGLPILRRRRDSIQKGNVENTEVEIQLDTESEFVEISDLENIPRQDAPPESLFEKLYQWEQGAAKPAPRPPVLRVLAFILFAIALFVWLF
jgi:hypothetical protein